MKGFNKKRAKKVRYNFSRLNSFFFISFFLFFPSFFEFANLCIITIDSSDTEVEKEREGADKCVIRENML